MPWVILVVAGFFEIAWALALKTTDGFTRLYPSLFTLIALAVSMFLLGVAARSLPIGTAYAVWVGIGAMGTALGGMLLFGEPATPARLAWLAVVLVGIVGLKATAR